MTNLEKEQRKALRESLVIKQDYLCGLCGERLDINNAVLDHDHDTGRVRAALHNGCNRAEGIFAKALRWMPKGDFSLRLTQILMFWSKSYNHMPYMPGHKFPEHSKIAKLKREMKSAQRQATKDRKKSEILLLKSIINGRYR